MLKVCRTPGPTACILQESQVKNHLIYVDYILTIFEWTPKLVIEANKRHAEKHELMRQMRRKGYGYGADKVLGVGADEEHSVDGTTDLQSTTVV